jgi:glycosyltransferase involved in cell wall biosynthesis
MAQSIKISAVIITFNEADNIERCLDSLQDIADEILVVDSYSTDKTGEICRKYNVRFIQHPFEGHVEQKNYAMSMAGYDHVLSLDGDEALSSELRQSIAGVKDNWGQDGYRFNRRTNYCGKWIRHSGWYPDTKLRLWNRTKGRWGGVNPHDRVVMDHNSRLHHLSGDLLHFSYPTIQNHISQINSFSDIAARAAFERGRRSNMALDICLNPMLTFFKKYLLKLGVLDGYEGFVISTSTAYGKFLKYIKLRELERQKTDDRRQKTKEE